MAKILAVDDSVSMRGMVAFTLRGAGHEVAEAENGQLALDLAQAGVFDLVLADVNMPVIGKAAGATGWLVKPFDPDQLLATVKRVLG